MKIDDLLKCKKVRCVKAYDDCLTVGKEYSVLDIRTEVKVKDDEGAFLYWESDHFEPVLDPTEKPPQVAKPKFKVREKVYFSTDPDIKTISEVGNDNDVQFAGESGWASGYSCCPATQENYEKLCSLFECIDFEQPPKPLTGSDLCRAMVDKGWFIVDCYVSAISDEDALRFRTKRMQVALFGDGLFTDGVKQFPFAVPFDSRTGNLLTEAVLDE